MTTTTRTCSCAWCMGIEPWRTDFATCIQEGWIAAQDAVAAREACFTMHPRGRFCKVCGQYENQHCEGCDACPEQECPDWCPGKEEES